MTNLPVRVLAAVFGAWLGLAPRVAFACPVCFSAQNEENRFAFVAMTAFLTLLPLGMLGLGLGWAWRKLRQQDGAEREPVMSDSKAPEFASTSNLPQ